MRKGKIKVCHIRIAALLLALPMVGCNWFTRQLCGEPSGERKKIIDSLNHRFSGTLVASEVPCYPGYFQVDLQKTVDASLIQSLDSFILSRGYKEVLFYDKNQTLRSGNTGSM